MPWRSRLPGCPNASMAPPSVPSLLTANDPILQSPRMVNTCALADAVAARATTTAVVATDFLTSNPFRRFVGGPPGWRGQRAALVPSLQVERRAASGRDRAPPRPGAQVRQGRIDVRRRAARPFRVARPPGRGLDPHAPDPLDRAPDPARLRG